LRQTLDNGISFAIIICFKLENRVSQGRMQE
jgi:hypothetical protein